METAEQATDNTQLIPWAWIKAVHHILTGPPHYKEPDHLPVQLTTWLFLSDEYNSIWQIDRLQNDLGITHVLTVNAKSMEEVETTRQKLKTVGIRYLPIHAQDNTEYDLLGNHWEQQLRPFLEQARRNKGKVVISCVAGVNRSGLVAAAAMLVLENNKMTLLEVVKTLKKKRGLVLTNASFQKQLCQLAAKEGLLGPKPTGYTDDHVPDSYFVPTRSPSSTTEAINRCWS